MYLMHHKHEVLNLFVEWKKMVETETGRKIKQFIWNNGDKYKSDPFVNLCQNEGIVQHFTFREMLQHNGVAECMNRMLGKVR